MMNYKKYKMNYKLLVFALVLLFFSCGKENKTFKISTVTINGHQKGKYPRELLSVRFLDGSDTQHVLRSFSLWRWRWKMMS